MYSGRIAIVGFEAELPSIGGFNPIIIMPVLGIVFSAAEPPG